MELAESTIASKDRALSVLESNYTQATASEDALRKQNLALSEECNQLKEANNDSSVLIENLQNSCSTLENHAEVFDQELGSSRFV